MQNAVYSEKTLWENYITGAACVRLGFEDCIIMYEECILHR